MNFSKMSLSVQILVAMALGVILGSIITSIPNDVSLFGSNVSLWLNEYLTNGFLALVKSWFVNSLKMIVVPLVLVSLICGTCSLSDPAKLGSMSTKSISLYLMTTAIAITIGIIFAVIVQPGAGVALASEAYNASEPQSIFSIFSNLIPTNVFSALVNANMLQIIIFSILFGLAISLSGERGKSIAAFFQDLNEVILRLVTIIMKFAPYGIFCIMAKVVAESDFEKLISLGKYFFLVIAVLIVHAMLVYPTLLRIFTGLNPIAFLIKMRPAMLFAFSSASSSATLPVTMELAEKRVGVGKSTSSFVLPLGATINMDGTAIMQGIATVFIAQQYAIDLSLGQYLLIILTATMASIGTAGVPSAGIVMLVGVLNQVGLPTESIALILGIDRILDMVRTAVNVTGDATVATIVSNWQDDFSKERFDDPEAGLEYEAEKL